MSLLHKNADIFISQDVSYAILNISMCLFLLIRDENITLKLLIFLMEIDLKIHLLCRVL